MSDDSFGPRYDGSFDFTLLFEQSFLSIAPSALLLAVVPWRIFVLSKMKSSNSAGATLLWTKLLPMFVLLGLQIANLVLWSAERAPRTRTSIAAAVLSVADVVAMGALLFTEHFRSPRPSTLLTFYLSLSILFDIASVRTLFLRDGMKAIGATSTAIITSKLVLVVLEEIPKRSRISAEESADEISKEATSGLWNRSVFWWLNSTFLQGFRSLLQVDDLTALDGDLKAAKLLDHMNREWRGDKKAAKHGLTAATFSAHRGSFIAAVPARLCFIGFNYAQPFLINRIIGFVGNATHDEENSRGTVGGLIGATALVYIGIALSRSHYKHRTYRFITAVRGGLVGLIFQKTLALDAKSAREEAAVTLMSTDVDGITTVLAQSHDMWASVIELGLGLYFLARQVGAACFLMLIPATLSSLAIGKIADGIGPARMAWNGLVQKRVAATSSVLNQIKGIKMIGLTSSVSQSVQSLRVAELDSSKAFRTFTVWINFIANVSDQLTPIAIIGAAVFWTKAGRDLSVADAFTTLSVVALVASPLITVIDAYPTIVGALACFTRIQTFLLLPGRNEHPDLNERSEQASSTTNERSNARDHSEGAVELENIPRWRSLLLDQEPSRPAIRIDNASFLLRGADELILRDLDITIPRSTLTMVIGVTGSGKSILLKSILGETQLQRGSVELRCAPVAYCDQVPWLRLTSIRNNILGPNGFQEEWYEKVIYCCCLNQDISQLEDGDQSLVGSGGIALSGGQKQRIALARALYARTPVLLLDDIFSGLDNTTAQTIFSRLFGDSGILRAAGTTVVLATHAVKYLPSSDHVIVLDESGRVIQQGPFKTLHPSDGYVRNLQLEEDSMSHVAEDASDKAEQEPGTAKLKGPAKEDTISDLTRQTGDLSLYKFYMDSVGALYFMLWLALGAAYIGFGKAPQIWLRVWTERGTTHDTAASFGLYLAFGAACAFSAFVAVWYFMIFVIPKSAKNLHWQLLQGVLRAPFWFFSTIDSSKLLNRFSQDMTLVDQVLPMAAFTTTFDVFTAVAETAIIAAGAQYVASIIPLCMLAVYLLQNYYLRTSRQIRHLDLEAKSPLYRSFTETASGIITIRAFNWQESLMSEHLSQLDYSQKPYYTLYCIQRWLNVVLDLSVAGVALVLVSFALTLPSTATTGSIGLALLNVMGFNNALSMLVNSWTGLETSLGAIARLKSFLNETPVESRVGEDQLPPHPWPQNGSVQIRNIVAKYNISDNTSKPAIDDVSLEIKAGQKIGVVGRTGSGKSSLILTILRLLELDSGAIMIDGLNVSYLNREALRSSMVTIPQEPVELPGSVRHNLDPRDSTPSATDDEMISALASVGLWGTIEERGGLDINIDATGLSSGQKQLFSLARAVLTVRRHGRYAKGGIILLDEPTSSVDGQTNKAIQKIIRQEFANYTIVIVTHRPDTIEDADVIIVMDSGKLVEVKKNR